MNGHDVTGGSDFKFSEAVDLSAVDSLANITAKLNAAGFKNSQPGSSAVMQRDVDNNITYVIVQGNPEIPGSYKARIRSVDGEVAGSHVEAMLGELEGILEPYNG